METIVNKYGYVKPFVSDNWYVKSFETFVLLPFLRRFVTGKEVLLISLYPFIL